MVVKNKHPAYASAAARLDKLRELRRLCGQALAAVRKAQAER